MALPNSTRPSSRPTPLPHSPSPPRIGASRPCRSAAASRRLRLTRLTSLSASRPWARRLAALSACVPRPVQRKTSHSDRPTQVMRRKRPRHRCSRLPSLGQSQTPVRQSTSRSCSAQPVDGCPIPAQASAPLYLPLRRNLRSSRRRPRTASTGSRNRPVADTCPTYTRARRPRAPCRGPCWTKWLMLRLVVRRLKSIGGADRPRSPFRLCRIRGGGPHTSLLWPVRPPARVQKARSCCRRCQPRVRPRIGLQVQAEDHLEDTPRGTAYLRVLSALPHWPTLSALHLSTLRKKMRWAWGLRIRQTHPC